MSASHTPDDDRHGGEVVPIDAARRDRRPVIFEDAEPLPLSAMPAMPAERVLEGRVIGRPQLSAIPVTVIKVIATPENARRVRTHAYYVAAGLAVAARHWRDSRSTAPYHEWIRMAKATGNHEQALEWEARLAAFRRDRHTHRRDRISGLATAVMMVPKVALGGAVGLGVTSVLVAIGTKNIRNIVLPTEFVAHVTDTAFAIVTTAWGPVMIAAPFAALAALWHTGRKHALTEPQAGSRQARPTPPMPGWWSRPTRSCSPCSTCRIPALKAAFKDGWMPVVPHSCRCATAAATRRCSSRRSASPPQMIADQRPVAGPQPAPRRGRNLDHRRRRRQGQPIPRRFSRRVDRRPRRGVGKPAPDTRCCTRASPTCSPAFPAASRRAATRCSIPIVEQQLRRRRPAGPGQIQRCAAWSSSAARWTRCA